MSTPINLQDVRADKVYESKSGLCYEIEYTSRIDAQVRVLKPWAWYEDGTVDAEVLLQLRRKWDACSHFYFAPNDQGYVHDDGEATYTAVEFSEAINVAADLCDRAMWWVNANEEENPDWLPNMHDGPFTTGAQDHKLEETDRKINLRSPTDN